MPTGLHGGRWCIRLTDCMPAGTAPVGLSARHASSARTWNLHGWRTCIFSVDCTSGASGLRGWLGMPARPTPLARCRTYLQDAGALHVLGGMVCMPTGAAMAGLASLHALDSLQTGGRIECKLVALSAQRQCIVSLLLLQISSTISLSKMKNLPRLWRRRFLRPASSHRLSAELAARAHLPRGFRPSGHPRPSASRRPKGTAFGGTQARMARLENVAALASMEGRRTTP